MPWCIAVLIDNKGRCHVCLPGCVEYFRKVYRKLKVELFQSSIISTQFYLLMFQILVTQIYLICLFMVYVIHFIVFTFNQYFEV